jgi:hypothetical protein
MRTTEARRRPGRPPPEEKHRARPVACTTHATGEPSKKATSNDVGQRALAATLGPSIACRKAAGNSPGAEGGGRGGAAAWAWHR